MILTPPDQIREYREKGYWGDDTLATLFARNVKATPDETALVDPPNRADLGIGNAKRLTYREVDEAANRLADALIAAGVKKDDIVMVQLPNVVELILTYLAAARIGVIVSPLPVQYRTHELKYTIDLTQPAAFITTNNFDKFNYLEMVRGLQNDFPFLKTIFALGSDLPAGVVSVENVLSSPHNKSRLNDYTQSHPGNADDIFTVCWTSGTEADPKGVPRSHNLWITIAYATVDSAQLDSKCSLLTPFPMVNMSGLGGMLYPWVLTGGKLVLHHPLALPVFLEQIKTEQINYTVAPPVLLNMLLLRPEALAQADLSTIKNIGSGSSPLTPWMTTEWKDKHQIDILNFFGSNEGIAMVSATSEIPDAAERAKVFPRYGVDEFEWSNRSTKGYSTRLVDPQTEVMITEPGKVGEIRIKGPTVFSGYFRRQDLTEKSFDKHGYFKTGDLFSIEQGADGKLSRYRFHGRLKDIIIRGGFNISPEELEGLLASHPKIADVAVVGYVDGRILQEEQICVVAVTKPEQQIDLSDVHGFLKEKDIAQFKMPKKLWVVPALPRNPVGKVLKRDLRAQLNQEHEGH